MNSFSREDRCAVDWRRWLPKREIHPIPTQPEYQLNPPTDAKQEGG